MQVKRAHKIRLNPTPEQSTAFIRCAGVSRFAWNWALSVYKETKAQGAKADWNDIKRRFRARVDAEFPFVREVTKCAPEHGIADLRQSISTYYKANRGGAKRVRFPGFRSRKKRIGGFGIATDKFECRENSVRLPKIGWVNMAESLRLDGKVLCGRVVEQCGRWYLVVTVEIERHVSVATGSIGIDFGLKTFAACSDGRTYETQAGYRKGQRKLRALQRSLSRKHPGSDSDCFW